MDGMGINKDRIASPWVGAMTRGMRFNGPGDEDLEVCIVCVYTDWRVNTSCELTQVNLWKHASFFRLAGGRVASLTGVLRDEGKKDGQEIIAKQYIPS